MVASICLSTSTTESHPKKIACIGDSITYNLDFQDPDFYSDFLRDLVNETNYEIRSFGLGGRTAQNIDGQYINQTTVI